MRIKHEDIGMEYLLSLGYKREDIKINNGLHDLVGVPDITTSDNNEWEIKILGISLASIGFTYHQLLWFKDSTNILIYRKSMREYIFCCCIKWKDLKVSNEYDIRISFELPIKETDMIISLIHGDRQTRFEHRASQNPNMNELYERRIKNKKKYGLDNRCKKHSHLISKEKIKYDLIKSCNGEENVVMLQKMWNDTYPTYESIKSSINRFGDNCEIKGFTFRQINNFLQYILSDYDNLKDSQIRELILNRG